MSIIRCKECDRDRDSDFVDFEHDVCEDCLLEMEAQMIEDEIDELLENKNKNYETNTAEEEA